VPLKLSQNGCSVWVTSSTELVLTPTRIALGKFDGVHLGHQQVIKPIFRPNTNVVPGTIPGTISEHPSPQEINSPLLDPTLASSTSERVYSTVVTFNPHPQEFFSGKPRAWLTPLDEKVQMLRSLGVEQLVLLPFDKELSSLPPDEFVEKILVQQLKCQQISVGQDFQFGRKRSGTAEDLKALAESFGIPVTIVPLQTCMGESCIATGERISTSLIRQHLAQGNIELANKLLGRRYTLIGSVVKGNQLGRTIGFPTANIQIPKQKYLPRFGVYAVRVKGLAEATDNTAFDCLGVMNIGVRPTVEGIYTTVEVHLFDWSGDLYCKQMVVELEKFLRPEQKFPSLEALKAQIEEDCEVAKAFFSQEC
jgi:riboflavin kinase / FMN adenylyltransferase